MLLRAPAGWPQPLVAAVAMVLLAVLDLGGALAAKEAIERRSIALAAAGAAIFLVLYWVYISSLEVAELSSVTFGWIVILQVGVVLLDRFRYGVIPAPGAWLAIALLLAAQTYLVLLPTAVPASAQGGDQRIEAVTDDVAERGEGQQAGADGNDQERLLDAPVSSVGHISPQRSYQSSPSLTAQGP